MEKKTAEAQRPEAHGQTSRDLMAYCDTCLVLRKVSRCLSRMREHKSEKFEGGMRAIPGATILPKVSHSISNHVPEASVLRFLQAEQTEQAEQAERELWRRAYQLERERAEPGSPS